MGISLVEKSGRIGRRGKGGSPPHTPSPKYATVEPRSRSRLTTLWEQCTVRVETGPFRENECRNCGEKTLELYRIRAVDGEKWNMCLICTIQEFELVCIYSEVSPKEEKCQTSQPKC